MACSDIMNAHNFFNNRDARSSYARCNTHFNENSWNTEQRGIAEFYSYSTVIGRIFVNKRGEEFFFVSKHSYSKTTAKHLAYLRHASTLSEVYFPDVERNPFASLLKRLESSAKTDISKFSAKDEREEFLFWDKQYQLLKEYGFPTKDMDKVVNRQSYRNRYLLITGDEKEMRKVTGTAKRDYEKRMEEARKRELERFKREKEKEEKLLIQKVNEKGKYIVSLRQLADIFNDRVNNSKLVGELVRPTVNSYLSYAWVSDDDDKVITSQRVVVPAEQVKRLLPLWKAKRGLVGNKIYHYTVVGRDDNFTRVGCHKIPNWNIELLCKYFEIE